MFFRAISAETVPNITSHHFSCFFGPSYFFNNKHACCNRRDFSVMHSCCCLTGLGLILLVLVLVFTFWSCFHHCLPNSNIQHGFRRGHSTTSALLELNSTISSGFNQKRPPCRTLLLEIDLSQAFDQVKKLLADLNNSSLPGAISKWFSWIAASRAANHVLYSVIASHLPATYILESHKVLSLPQSCLTSTCTVSHHHQLVST